MWFTAIMSRLSFKKDTVFVRNFTIFVLLLLGCVGLLSYFMISGQRDLDKSDDWIVRTYKVIAGSEAMMGDIRAMLADQRGYLLSKDADFLSSYDKRKMQVSNEIARLRDLTQDNPSQQSRLKEIQTHFLEFSNVLEERARVSLKRLDARIIDGIEIIDAIKDDITRINNAFLAEEYALLNTRVKAVEIKRDQYFDTLIIGTLVGAILLLVFNGFLLRAQKKRSSAEQALDSAEERLKLAIEGTQDGIFDWDIGTGKVFYSRQFFSMLGIDKGPITGTTNDFKDLLHADDQERVWTYLDQYLGGQLSEYNIEFRVKHESGRWVWVQSRAKASFDKNGEPIRFVGAHTDITHIKRAQEKLESEKQTAEEATRAKSDFLAHMSHEIRTPLTAISGIAEIFQKDKSGFDNKQAKLLDTLANSAQGLKDLINDVLDFSSIESHQLEMSEEVFPINRVFEEMVSMMAVRANEKGISFVCDYEAVRSDDFYGDKLRLRQIVVNLIGNAIKFTDNGGVSVNVAFEDRGGHDFLRVDVSDTGVGISADDFDLVFERFKQADTSESRRFGGTGLGLPISKNLAILMGGDIFVSSQVGKGSTFSLILPAKIARDSARTPVKEQDIDKLNDKISNAINGNKKVLIVEDYVGNVVVISHMLDDVGLDYDVANDGQEGLEFWKKHHYDLVLMDVQMPRMDGFAATQAIREAEASTKDVERTPIIGMTAHALVGDKDKCIAAGMDAYLPKPIVEADFKKQILKFLNKQKKAA